MKLASLSIKLSKILRKS